MTTEIAMSWNYKVRKYASELWILINQRNSLTTTIVRRQSEVCKELGISPLAWIAFMRMLRMRHDTRNTVLVDVSSLMGATKNWTPPPNNPTITKDDINTLKVVKGSQVNER